MKVISFHVDKCKNPCINSDICYLRHREMNKESNDRIDKDEHILKYMFMDTTKEYYIAICNKEIIKSAIIFLKSWNINLNKIHFTTNYDIYKESHKELKDYEKNTQVSIYSKEQWKELNNSSAVCPSYLIRDDKSLEVAKELLNDSNSRGHLNIYQGYIEQYNDKANEILALWIKGKAKNISIDTCLESYARFKKCAFQKMYVDIHHDGTIRRCPFNSKGVNIDTPEVNKQYYIQSNGTIIPRNNVKVNKSLIDINRLYKIKHEPNCIYHKLYGGK